MLAKVSVYKTEDGETFDSKAAAMAHQREVDLGDLGFDVEALKTNADVLSTFLRPFRTIKPRAKKAA